MVCYGYTEACVARNYEGSYFNYEDTWTFLTKSSELTNQRQTKQPIHIFYSCYKSFYFFTATKCTF